MDVLIIGATYLLVGAAAGVLAGLFGVGGGAIIVPALVFIFALQGIHTDVAMHMAIGTSLATIVFTGISSARAHHRKGNVLINSMKQMAPGLVIGVILGGWIAGQLSGGLLGMLFGCFLLMVAANLVFGKKESATVRESTPARNGIAGTVIGIASAFFGIGGGTLTVPWLAAHGANMKQAAGTSSACGVFIALFGAITYVVTGWAHPHLPPLATGYVLWPAFIGITVSSIVFVRVGVMLSSKLPQQAVRLLFASFLVVIGLTFIL